MRTASFKMLVRASCLSLLLSSAGCGTMVSHFGDCGSTPPPGVYRGTVFDAGCMAMPFSSEPHLEYLPIGIIDLPFSLAADTLIFPFDLADYIERKNKEKPSRSHSQDGANGRQPSGSETDRTSTATAPEPSH